MTYINETRVIKNSEHQALIKDVNVIEERPNKYLLPIAIIWVCILISGFFTSIKSFEIFGITFFVAAIAYPFTYIFNDIFTEVYGYRTSRKVIWSGLVGVFLATLITSVYSYIPAGPDFDQASNDAFNIIFRASPLIAAAGVVSFFLGEWTNSVILAKLKVKTCGHYESLRCIASTFFGQIVDNGIFILLLSLVLNIFSLKVGIEGLITTVIFCTLWEILAYPIFTKPLIKWIKKEEGFDAYDYETKFNIL